VKIKPQNLFQDPLSRTLLAVSCALFLLSLVFYMAPAVLL